MADQIICFFSFGGEGVETESGFFQFCEVSVLCVNRVQVVPSSLTAYYFFTDKASSNLFEIQKLG